jgi:hypothetical protein
MTTLVDSLPEAVTLRQRNGTTAGVSSQAGGCRDKKNDSRCPDLSSHFRRRVDARTELAHPCGSP